MAELTDDADLYAGRVVVFRAEIHDTGVHGMFLTEPGNDAVLIPLSANIDVRNVPGFVDLIRLLADKRAVESRIVGTVKGVKRYAQDGSPFFEPHELRDLKLEPRPQ